MESAIVTISPPVGAQASGVDEQLAAAIAGRISEPRYNLWFRAHTKFVFLGDALVVGVPNLYFHDWLQKTFGVDVRSAAAEVLGSEVAVRFAIDPELFQAQRQAEKKADPAPKTEPQLESSPRPPKPKRRFRSLADFVVGPCNRVAHASALSVVEDPGLGANPLVLYGPTGTGKTHLLEGVYGGLRRRHPDARIVFASAEEFMNRFVAAVHRGKQAGFRSHFRDCHALLLDDLSFLAGKKATQIEFLHTFDAILAEGSQIVLTCDCHPRLADDLAPELADRLLGGAVWGVLPPDADTRLALLRSKSMSGPISEDVLQYLATNLRGNVRELEGALHAVRHFARVSARPITRDLAREALGDLFRHAVRVVRVADIDGAVSAALKLPAGSLRSKSKAWSVSHARMLAIYLARQHTSATFGEISLYFGNKSHSAAVAAEKRVRGWIDRNESIKAGDREWKARDLLDRVERELQAGPR